MNVLDIAENSVRANASRVHIAIVQDTGANVQTLTIADNGKGMDAAMVAAVTDPFTTTRTTRKVGLGLPFLKMAAQQTGGALFINSAVGRGTTITATFGLAHIDLMPLGDMGSTISALVQASPHIDFDYRFARNGREFVFSTKEARQILDGVPLNAPEVVLFIRGHVNEGMEEIFHPGKG